MKYWIQVDIFGIWVIILVETEEKPNGLLLKLFKIVILKLFRVAPETLMIGISERFICTTERTVIKLIITIGDLVPNFSQWSQKIYLHERTNSKHKM